MSKKKDQQAEFHKTFRPKWGERKDQPARKGSGASREAADLVNRRRERGEVHLDHRGGCC